MMQNNHMKRYVETTCKVKGLCVCMCVCVCARAHARGGGSGGIVRDKMSQQIGKPRTELIELTLNHKVEGITLMGQLENIWRAGH